MRNLPTVQRGLKSKFKPGTRVTATEPVEGYYSNYGGNGPIIFKTGMIGVVSSIQPKVYKIGYGSEFLVVDYTDSEGKTRRVALDFNQAIVVS